MCFVVDTCRAKGGWKLEGDFVKTSDGNDPNSYLLLSMSVPGFRGHHIQRGSTSHGDVGHVDFVFETSCQSNCEFAFMKSNTKELVVVGKWKGTQSKQHFRFDIVLMYIINFKVMLFKVQNVWTCSGIGKENTSDQT